MSNLVHIVCPHCQAVNRLPEARLGASPNCGKCHKALFTGHPTEVDTLAFERHIKHTDIPVVVDFWAPWCGPCRMMAPYYVQAATQLEPRVRLLKANVEDEQQLGTRYAIRSIPTLALFRAGTEVARLAGALDRAGILRWVQAHLDKLAA